MRIPVILKTHYRQDGYGFIAGLAPDDLDPTAPDGRTYVRGEIKPIRLSLFQPPSTSAYKETTSGEDGTWIFSAIPANIRHAVIGWNDSHTDLDSNYYESQVRDHIEAYTGPLVKNEKYRLPVGEPFTEKVEVAYGEYPLTWSVQGSLPSGVTFDEGVFSASWPTGTAGVYPVTVTVTDSNGESSKATVELHLDYMAPTIASFGGLFIEISGSISYTAQAKYGEPPYTYLLTGATPLGVSIDANTGEMTGSISTLGAYDDFNVAVMDARSTLTETPAKIYVVDHPDPSQLVVVSPFDGEAINMVSGELYGPNGGSNLATIDSSGQFGDCASFNNSGFGLTDARLAFGTGEYTIEFWVWPINAGAGNPSGRCVQIGANNATGCLTIHRKNNTNPMRVEMSIYSGGWVNFVSTDTLANDQWHHIAVTRDSSGDVRIFLNGVIQATNNSTHNHGLTQLSVGQSPTGSDWFNGKIDDLIISRVCLYTANFVPPANPFVASS